MYNGTGSVVTCRGHTAREGPARKRPQFGIRNLQGQFDLKLTCFYFSLSLPSGVELVLFEFGMTLSWDSLWESRCEDCVRPLSPGSWTGRWNVIL